MLTSNIIHALYILIIDLRDVAFTSKASLAPLLFAALKRKKRIAGTGNFTGLH
jgi:hypothetical protein